MIANLFINLGQKVIAFLYFLGGLSNLAAQTFYWTFVPPYQKKRIFDQAKRTGFDSLLIVSLIGMFIGMIMGVVMFSFCYMTAVPSEYHLCPDLAGELQGRQNYP